MIEEIIIAGSGGQGTLLLGEVLAIGSLYQGKKATWLPSYGPEMRGGTANCSVVISDDAVGSPVVEQPTLLVCFNQPSLVKFGPRAAKNGMIFVNDDAIEAYPPLQNVEVLKLKVASAALELGNPRALNMVMLGAILAKKNYFDIDVAMRALAHVWGEQRAQKLLPLNRKAVEQGIALAQR